MVRNMIIPLLILVLILMSSCSNESSKKDGDYDATKKMVVDILQTEDGKKALEEIMTDEKMKQQLIIQSDVVKDSINEVLVTEKGAEMWGKLFKDPTFVQDFAKSMEDSQEELMKSLMNDAEYQKLMINLLQNPEITEQMLQLLKSQQFREHLQETIEETLDTPLFQAKMTEILLKAAEKKGKQEESDKDDSSKESSEEGENEESGDDSDDPGGDEASGGDE